MGIETIENEIIAHLEGSISSLKIEGFPEKPNEYQLIHPKGAILVSYTNSSFDEQSGFESIQQTEEMEFALLLMIRGLRDKNGAYTYIDTIKNVLTGFEPTGCTKIFPTDISFLREENAVWYYTMGFKTSLENVDYD